MLSKLKKMFTKNNDKIVVFNEKSNHLKFGVQIALHMDNGKYMIYVNDIFASDTVIAIFNSEEEVSEFIDELTTEISANFKQRQSAVEERLVKDLNKLTYLHKRNFKHLFIAHYKKTMFTIYLNKKVVNHVNNYIEETIFGEDNGKQV